MKYVLKERRMRFFDKLSMKRNALLPYMNIYMNPPLYAAARI